MRNSLLISSFMAGVMVAFVATGAVAQSQTPPAQNGPQNPAISGSSNKQADAPVKGANSFTEGEAKSRIEAKGFANVNGLKKDDNGVWRGTAMKDGSKVEVSLDYQGNVITR